MRCADVMTKNMLICWAHESAALVAQRMRSANVGFLPVCTDSGEVIGTITDRDLAIRVVADALDALSTPVIALITRGVVTCSPSDPIAVAEDLMRTYQKSRIVCVDRWRRPVGVLSLTDIADADWRRSGRILRDVTRREARAHAPSR